MSAQSAASGCLLPVTAAPLSPACALQAQHDSTSQGRPGCGRQVLSLVNHKAPMHATSALQLRLDLQCLCCYRQLLFCMHTLPCELGPDLCLQHGATWPLQKAVQPVTPGPTCSIPSTFVHSSQAWLSVQAKQHRGHLLRHVPSLPAWPASGRRRRPGR